ncbi:protein ORF128 [Cyprinid herpesvirus 3]|uniref:ORF128L n=1 Tax=Cyprinid herpesvirus 3 TaxID=180230 RepID=A3QTT7_CYHV3|nr:unnamed protein product [Cyprinid herpesvirus 3]ABG42955.1 protein ORF128 [Cyprinid herpesvirus 3]AIC32483.1 ORF128L [Cyprinid herpesvirus 3]AJP55615.1 protein ORF128 [Cyprinid herpesvirus 3]AJP55770.1 protein ORF128 [Cyprinid herpesvirus 3]AOO32532.1 protein ORF128 [Cyprinid herpesvirus 3]
MEYQDISRHLTCLKCSGLFKDPVTVPCGHSVCRACLKVGDQCDVCMIDFWTHPDELTTSHSLKELVDAVYAAINVVAPPTSATVRNKPTITAFAPCGADVNCCNSDSTVSSPEPYGAAAPSPDGLRNPFIQTPQTPVAMPRLKAPPPSPPPVPCPANIPFHMLPQTPSPSPPLSPPPPPPLPVPVKAITPAHTLAHTLAPGSGGARGNQPPPAPRSLLERSMSRQNSGGGGSSGAKNKKYQLVTKLRRLASDLEFRERWHMRLLCHKYMVDTRLDVATAHPNVKVGYDGVLCYYTKHGSSVPPAPTKRTFVNIPAVMTKNGHFTALYFEVHVDNKQAWTFGVCTYNVDRLMYVPAPVRGAWTISLREDGNVCANTDNGREPINKGNAYMSKVGVLLDPEVGSVQFVDAVTYDTLYVFQSQSVGNVPMHAFLCPEIAESVPMILSEPKPKHSD